MTEKLLSLAETARQLGISSDQLDNMRLQGKIRAVRDGASWKFRGEEVERIVSEVAITPAYDGQAESSCEYCGYVPLAPAQYCSRCGGALAVESLRSALEKRLRTLRILLRNRIFRGLFGFAGLTAETRAVEILLKICPQLRTECRWAFECLRQDLVQLFEETDAPRLIKVLSLTLTVLPNEDRECLERHQSRLDSFIKNLRDANTRLTQGKASGQNLADWFHKVASTLSLDQLHARHCVYACPESWPQVAALLDPAMHQQAQPRLHHRRGIYALIKEEHAIAETHFSKALAADPAYVPAIEGLAFACHRQGQEEKALTNWREAVQRGTVDPMTFNNLAWFLSQAADISPADQHLALWAAERAVELAPIASYWDTLAHVRYVLGDAQRAIVAARMAIQDNPDRAEYRQRMGQICDALEAHERIQRDVAAAMRRADEPRQQGSVALVGEAGESELDFEDLMLEPSKRRGDDLPKSDESVLDDSDLSGDEGDTGINFSSDSGLNLEEEPLDLAGSSISSLELPEDEDLLDVEDLDSEPEAVVADQADEDFLLAPSLDLDEAEDSGSQVIALEDFEAFDAPLGMPEPLEDVEPSPAVPSGTSTSRGAFGADSAVLDAVDCSVFSPPQVAAADSTLVQVFVHQPKHADQARAMAEEFDDQVRRRGMTALGTHIARGSSLTFELRTRDLIVEEPTQELIWLGDPASVQFEVQAPEGLRPRACVVTLLVTQASVPIGQIKFKLQVVAAGTPLDTKKVEAGEASRFRRAFISYASQDRSEVTRRVQMLKAVGIECFQDVLSLDPGERWEKALYRHIDEADVLFLFWSSNAKRSEWVERKWRYGLQRKGEDAVRPVIIEGPPIVPPPPELAHLHFNDPLMYFVGPS